MGQKTALRSAARAAGPPRRVRIFILAHGITVSCTRAVQPPGKDPVRYASFSSLQVAFAVPGDFSFTVWGHGTKAPWDDVHSPHYFRLLHNLLQEGDLIYVCRFPPEGWQNPRKWTGPRHLKLLVVEELVRGKRCCTRVVQDFGRPREAGPDTGAEPEAVPPAARQAASPRAAARA